MMLMIIAVLVVLGLCLGSFVNALVWRVHEQAKQGKKASKELSVLKGRSICPHCHHQLKALDLVPLFSWLALRGRCRYCKKPISKQYPLVELATAALFVASYWFWPSNLLMAKTVSCPPACLFSGASLVADVYFVLWLVVLTGLMALVVYDLRWYLLPNRILYPVSVIAGVMAVITILDASKPLTALLNTVMGVAVGGGIFYLLFQVSKGKWIGGGDVKLGWLLGLLAGTPGKALLFIFLAAILGTLFSVPLLAVHRLKRSSRIPFGPFLIAGAVITVLFGSGILNWYIHSLLKV